jgi:hypothetical protein
VNGWNWFPNAGRPGKAKNKKGNKIMKNQTADHKSTVSRIKPPLVLAACLILAALGPPTAELSRAQGRGSPPSPIDFTEIFPGGVFCDFDVQVDVSGRQGVINLPSGGLILIEPASVTFTNLSYPTKSVTLHLGGAFNISFDQNGDTIYNMAAGRSAFIVPSFGFLLLVGDFTLVFDPNGNLIQGPTGNGQITNICDLIN